MPRIVSPMEPTLDLAQPGVQYGPIKPNPPLYEPAKPLSRSTTDNTVTSMTNTTATSMSPTAVVNHPSDAIISDNADDETAEEKKKRLTREKSAATRRRNKEAERARQEEVVQLREEIRRRDEILEKVLPSGVTLQAVLSGQLSPSKVATIALMNATSAKDEASPTARLKFDASPAGSMEQATPVSAQSTTSAQSNMPAQSTVAPSQLQIQKPLPAFGSLSSPLGNPSVLTNTPSTTLHPDPYLLPRACNPSVLTNTNTNTNTNTSTLPPNPYTLPPIRSDQSAIDPTSILHTINIQQDGLRLLQQAINQCQHTISSGQQTIWAHLVRIQQRLQAMNDMPVYIDQNAMDAMNNMMHALDHQRGGLEMRGSATENHMRTLEHLMVMVGVGGGHQGMVGMARGHGEVMMSGGGPAREPPVDQHHKGDGAGTASKEEGGVGSAGPLRWKPIPGIN